MGKRQWEQGGAGQETPALRPIALFPIPPFPHQACGLVDGPDSTE